MKNRRCNGCHHAANNHGEAGCNVRVDGKKCRCKTPFGGIKLTNPGKRKGKAKKRSLKKAEKRRDKTVVPEPEPIKTVKKKATKRKAKPKKVKK